MSRALSFASTSLSGNWDNSGVNTPTRMQILFSGLVEDHTNWGVKRVLAAGGRELSGCGVALQDNDICGVLVTYDQPSTIGRHGEVSRAPACAGNSLDQSKMAVRGIDGKRRDTVVAAIRSVQKTSVRMNLHRRPICGRLVLLR